jgi:hypothetical protein
VYESGRKNLIGIRVSDFDLIRSTFFQIESLTGSVFTGDLSEIGRRSGARLFLDALEIGGD